MHLAAKMSQIRPRGIIRRIERDGNICYHSKIEMRSGQQGECHRNSVELLRQRPDLSLWTGFYLDGDDHWIRHSWLIDGDSLIETTDQGSLYFGYALGELQVQILCILKTFHENPNPDGAMPTARIKAMWRAPGARLELPGQSRLSLRGETP